MSHALAAQAQAPQQAAPQQDVDVVVDEAQALLGNGFLAQQLAAGAPTDPTGMANRVVSNTSLVQAQQPAAEAEQGGPGDWFGELWARITAMIEQMGAGQGDDIDGGTVDSGTVDSGTVDSGTVDSGTVSGDTGSGSVTQPAPPALDLTQYEGVLSALVTAGLTRQDAEALVQSATEEQLAQASNPGDSTHVAPGEPEVPSAELAPHAANRARPLDWDQNPRAGHISPETPEGATDQEVSNQTLATTHGEHRDALFTEEFGEGVTLEQVRGAISLAEALGQPEAAAALRARLFRVNQYAVVESLDVETSGRYQPGGGNTYCNIYAYDVVTALGAYIPRVWWYDATINRIRQGAEAVTVEEYERRRAAGEPTNNVVRPVYGETVREMNANSLNQWMRDHGGAFGWTQAADMGAAQDAANGGQVVVVLAANANARRSGHITVVLAETEDNTAARDENGEVRAPLQSQAGSRNFKASNNDAGAGRDQWWENASHVDGAAWINSGSGRSPVVTPESLGL